MADLPDYFLDADDDVPRLKRQHEIIKQAMGGSLVIAPVDLTISGLRVLDSGTSDGFWISDFLKDYPGYKTVVGCDIDPSRFPASLQQGVSFVTQDVTSAWPAEWKNSFDFVHQRLVLMGSRGDCQPVVNNLLSLVKPGGWVQLIEGDFDQGPTDGPASRQFVALLKGMSAALGNSEDYSKNMAGYLREAGFELVGEMTIPLCLGSMNPVPRLREQSVQSCMVALGGLIEFAKRLQSKEMTAEELDSLPERYEAELRSQGAYFPLRAVWGRKPVR